MSCTNQTPECCNNKTNGQCCYESVLTDDKASRHVVDNSSYAKMQAEDEAFNRELQRLGYGSLVASQVVNQGGEC